MADLRNMSREFYRRMIQKTQQYDTWLFPKGTQEVLDFPNPGAGEEDVIPPTLMVNNDDHVRFGSCKNGLIKCGNQTKRITIINRNNSISSVPPKTVASVLEQFVLDGVKMSKRKYTLVASKKKFWNPRKWFKRKTNKAQEDITVPSNETLEVTVTETIRSRSTSEISETDETQKRRSGTPMHPGLSVSHDSIFHSPHSESELELEEAPSSSSLSIQQHQPQTELRLKTELSERLRLRRGRGDTSEDDEGLPRSPCCNSPTATEGLLEKTAIKNHPTKSHSTCSDGSLLSMGSSDIEEDSFGQQSSKNSSKISLHEKKSSEQDSDWELGPSHASAPLNHSAAHHRVAVRPKRTHGAPRRNRIPPAIGSALPTTPEVNEDSSLRSVTPEVTRESVTELYSKSVSMSKNRTEIQLKCSSLPPGLAPPGSETNKLSRSRSSASSKSQDAFTALGEEDEDRDDKKSDSSLFARLFPRRSAKKKKSKQETVFTSTVYSKQTVVEDNSVGISVKVTDKKIISDKPKSGPASRQRILPIDIPSSPEQVRRELEPEKPTTSPLHLELENHLRQRLTLSLSTTPTTTLPTVEIPPKSPKAQEVYEHPIVSAGSVEEHPKEELKTVSRINIEDHETSKHFEENKSKVKIAGLSSLQQRALQLNEDESFKSLTEFTYNEKASITKSHSFKTSLVHTETSTVLAKSENNDTIDNYQVKTSSSMDSIKNLKIVNSFEVNKDSLVADSCDTLESITSSRTNSNEFLDSLNMPNGITISGPSHTSVVSVSKYEENVVKAQPIQLKEELIDESFQEEQVFKEQVSITKIHLKREAVQTTGKEPMPEFLNVHLNKVDAQPLTNIVLTANLVTPKRVVDNDDKPKNVFNFDLPTKTELENSTRKFSQDDIEIIDKDVNEEVVEVPFKNVSTPTTPNVVITSMTPPPSARLLKKPPDTVQTRKTSLVSVTAEPKPKLSLKTKSNSLDFVDSLKQDDMSPISTEKQKVLSTTDLTDTTVLRRKSLIKQRQDEEPELMKVFARRSLKVKDGDELAQQVLMMVDDVTSENGITTNVVQENNKENHASPPVVEERKKSAEKLKEPLVETKFVETTEVTLRKPINNKILAYQQRTISVNISKSKDAIVDKVQKKNSFSERPKTEISDKFLNKSWITNMRKDDVSDDIKKITQSDIITEIGSKSDFINEDFPTIPKNFNQRKAEWEKRAQEALKKNVP
ncbi:hypothetical protein FQR65_LT10684 [Abscondita terminalis]|nr:hypothetical protein FQR65_LT10684 [Abscondita terminalis]